MTAEVYVPTLAVLADPRWKPVSDDLAAAFEDLPKKEPPGSHYEGTLHGPPFPQILAGEEARTPRARLASSSNMRSARLLFRSIGSRSR